VSVKGMDRGGGGQTWTQRGGGAYTRRRASYKKAGQWCGD